MEKLGTSEAALREVLRICSLLEQRYGDLPRHGIQAVVKEVQQLLHAEVTYEDQER